MSISIRNIALMLCACICLSLQAQKQLEITYEKDGEKQTVFTDKVTFLRHGQSERYAWKPSSSSASNYNSLGKDFDISHVLSISRNVTHTSRLTLPENSPITAADVLITGEDEESFSINDKGEYQTSLSMIDAITKDGKPLYTCWATSDSVERVNPANLNAEETAITFLLEVFPLFAEQTKNKDFWHLKDMLRQLDETQALAKAIDASIVKNGYLNRTDIDKQYDNAIKKVITLLGWDKLFRAENAAGTRSPAAPPYTKYYGAGLRIEIDKSEWVHSYSADANVWQCELSAYNYNRFGYTAIAKGKTDKNGVVTLYDDDWAAQLRYIVKPQRVTSSFFDHIEFWQLENWEEIAEFYGQSYQFIVGDIELDEMTWDEEKKHGIKFDFEKAGDVVVALGSKHNVNVLVYNLMQAIGKPILKKVQKKFKKVAFDNLHSESELTEYFINKIVLDAGFISSTTIIMEDEELTAVDKSVKIGEKLFDKFKEFLWIELESKIQGKIESSLWTGTGIKYIDTKYIDKLDYADLQNSFDDAFATLEKVKKYGDWILSGLGLFEGNSYFDLGLDYQDPGITIPDVDGFDM